MQRIGWFCGIKHTHTHTHIYTYTQRKTKHNARLIEPKATTHYYITIATIITPASITLKNYGTHLKYGQLWNIISNYFAPLCMDTWRLIRIF